jgi:hypothetical protein
MRTIEPEMIKWLDDRLKDNGLVWQAMVDANPRLVFRCAMEACVGIRESAGNNMGPMVKLLQRTIGEAVKEPWCMSLVQTCLAYAERKCGVLSRIYPTEHCMTCWRETPGMSRVKNIPLPGAIIIWRNGSSDAGHTGMVVEAVRGNYLLTVEGNTGADGSRDGDGVYHKKRDWYADGSLKRIGFLKPFG